MRLINNDVRSVPKAKHLLAKILILGLFCLCADCKEKPQEGLDPKAVLANAPNIPIGHQVRIRSTRATLDAGLAGALGTLSGFTTPSQTGIAVIGDGKYDVAFAVQLKNTDTQSWFDPELLEFVGRTSSLEIEIYGKRWIWNANGSLIRSPAP